MPKRQGDDQSPNASAKKPKTSGSDAEQASETPASTGSYFLRVTQAVAAVIKEGLGIVEAAQKFNVLKATVQFKVQKELSELTKNAPPASMVQISAEKQKPAVSVATVETPSATKTAPKVSPKKALTKLSKKEGKPAKAIKVKIKREPVTPKKPEPTSAPKLKQKSKRSTDKVVKDDDYKLRVSQAAEAFLRCSEPLEEVAQRFNIKSSSVKRRLEQWERVLGLNRNSYDELAHKLKEVGGSSSESTVALSVCPSKDKKKLASSGRKQKKHQKQFEQSIARNKAESKPPLRQVIASSTSIDHGDIIEECEVEFATSTLPVPASSMKAGTLSSLADVALSNLAVAAFEQTMQDVDFHNQTSMIVADTVLNQDVGATYTLAPNADLYVTQSELGGDFIVSEIPQDTQQPQVFLHNRRGIFLGSELPATITSDASEEIAAAVASIQAGNAAKASIEPAAEEPVADTGPLVVVMETPKPRELTPEERQVQALVERHCGRCTSLERDRILKALLLARTEPSLSLINVAKKCEAPLVQVKKCWELVRLLDQPKPVHKKRKSESLEHPVASRVHIPKIEPEQQQQQFTKARSPLFLADVPQPRFVTSSKPRVSAPPKPPMREIGRVFQQSKENVLQPRGHMSAAYVKENLNVSQIPLEFPTEAETQRWLANEERQIKKSRLHGSLRARKAFFDDESPRYRYEVEDEPEIHRSRRVSHSQDSYIQHEYAVSNKRGQNSTVQNAPTSFLLWFQEQRARYAEINPEPPSKKVMQELGKQWQLVPEVEKEIWRKRALKLRSENRLLNRGRPAGGRRFGSLSGGRQSINRSLLDDIPLSTTNDPLRERLNWARHSRAVLRRSRPASPPRTFATDAMDIAGHFRLIAESMTDLGTRLQTRSLSEEMTGQSFDVLLDAFLCSLTPLISVTQYVDQIYDAAKESDLAEAIDNSVYLMPIAG